MKFILPKFSSFMLALSMGSLLLFSCKKTFDIKPETTLDPSQVYRNVFDADAAVIGIYGKLMSLAKQYVILNELRADLMEVTNNADANLRDINTHSATTDNPYADPRPFYTLINDCNDVLKNFNIMLQDNKFKVDEYNPRYSDIGALRSWLYLQLGIHFGSVPYITQPIENINDLKDQSQYPLIPFNQLLDSLISFTESLPFKNPYLPGTSLTITIDASNTSRFFIEKNAFLGDLHLWKGNYNKAATYYRAVLESTGYFNDNVQTPVSSQNLNQFKISGNAAINVAMAISSSYIRYHENDIGSYIDNNSVGWRSMFARSQDAVWRQEWLWELPFNSNFSPVNPFIDLFSNIGGSYLVKPSQTAINYWNSETQANGHISGTASVPGTPYDGRGFVTWRMLNGQPVIVKYLYNYLSENNLLQPLNLLAKNGQWFLNRATAVHLRFAEAANRDGRHRLSLALLNNGIANGYPLPTGVTDPTNYNQTNDVPPYDFDARSGTFLGVTFHGLWTRNQGVRGAAYLFPVTVPAGSDSTLTIENALIKESALELAYEGFRWPDLVRIALRRNDPSFLADKVYDKLLKDGNAQADAVRAKLMDPKNWYLPFKWK